MGRIKPRREQGVSALSSRLTFVDMVCCVVDDSSRPQLGLALRVALREPGDAEDQANQADPLAPAPWHRHRQSKRFSHFGGV